MAKHAALIAILIAAGMNAAWGAAVTLPVLAEMKHPLALVLFSLPLIWVLLSTAWAVHTAFSSKPRLLNIWAGLLYFLSGAIMYWLVNAVEKLMLTSWMLLIWTVLGLLFLVIYSPLARPRILAFVATLLIMMGAFEGLTRLYVRSHHAYQVQVYMPHPELGWTYIPHHEYTSSGSNPLCVSYTNTININSLGFRDREHEIAKPDGVIRIAVLGDSFVDATEVPLDQRAANRLEQQLNEVYETEFEVLVFGVDNYSVGQYWLAYQTFVEQFEVDYVFAYVSEFNLDRILNSEFSPVRANNDRLRPAFKLVEGELVMTPPDPEDYAAAVETYESKLDANGVPISQPLYIRPAQITDWRNRPLQSMIERVQFFNFMSSRVFGLLEYTLRKTQGFHKGQHAVHIAERSTDIRDTNLAVLAALNADVTAAGGTFIIIDDTYSPGMSEAVQAFAAQENIAVTVLNEAIIAANKDGISTSFLCDGHYNAYGNQLMAESMFRWLSAQPKIG